MAAREKKLDQGYQGYQKWWGVFEKEYIWWNIQADKRLWGWYEFRADNKGLFINDRAMQGFRTASGFRKAHRLTA